ncbi:uncharacterized protein Z518_02214 [Rhinocladiella mackenziei CBS 650.93]|uniref:Zn(2)-C6 fungal-type domain-containing protein n=1 Tax=Rhinocladiella mackenziei CBS 650.93 TaxID=1442369 RepID=A0A0D2IWB1_9EURO|nr:uncharacterized protein Z518_02214 [Rhinocladiella mackenziei CBS 650.93]KIX07561.1 hypothetical protein Z518_02214 [Rhinocladiella mackenziei CBS 650.93]
MPLQNGNPSTPRTSNRVTKKRASQACHHCRTRKVKCDLVKSGVPCHNCSSDGIECVIVESRRSRKYRLQKRQLNCLVSLPPLTQAQPKPPSGPYDGTNNPPSIATNTTESTKGVSDHATAPSMTNSHFHTPPARTLSVKVLPCVRPPPSQISPDDFDFLARRGALTIPDVELRDQLFRCFALYVSPYLPVVDLEDLFDSLDGKPNSSKISLILLQAIMFAGTAFVDWHFLQEAGYETRRAARGDFYQKIKLLYDFDWEADRVSVIQSLLIINYWYVSENDQKDPWHWLGVCVSLATSIGMNQPATYARKDPRTSRLWRRIWWACVMRDRIMAVSMRRPLRIKDEDINLPLLTLDDFETRSINVSSVQPLRDCPFLTDIATRRMLADLCLAKVKLLVSIGHIIRHFYHLRGFGGSTAEVTMLYAPKKSDDNGNEVAALQDDLDTWYRNLPVSCWLIMDNNNGGTHDTVEDVLFLHRSVLKMLFLMASESLNRPQTLSKTRSLSEQRSTSKVKEAADKMSEMIQHLHDRDLVRFLPPLSVSFMLLAIAVFLVEIKSKGQGFGALPGEQFHHCIRALLRLRDIWPIADSACLLIGQMITKSHAGGMSTPGIQPAPIGVTGRLDPLPQPPEHSGRITAQAFEYENAGGPEASSPPPSDPKPSSLVHEGQPVMGPEGPPPAVTTSELLDDPAYSWTASDFDMDFGSITNGHALHMDLALAEWDVTGVYENGLLDFQGDEGNSTAYTSAGPSIIPETWNAPADPGPYMEPFQPPPHPI